MKVPFFFTLIFISSFSLSQSFINEVIVKAPSPSSANTNSLVFWSGSEWVGREGIELFNPTCEVLDLSHWFLVVHGSAEQLRGTFRFPAGTTVAVEGLISIGSPFTQNDTGAPIMTILFGAGSSELSSVARCVGYLAGNVDTSAQNNGNRSV